MNVLKCEAVVHHPVMHLQNSTWLQCGHYPPQAFVWAAGLQMLLSTPRLSATAGMAGLLAGAIYQLNPLGLRRFKVCTPCSCSQSVLRLHALSLDLLAVHTVPSWMHEV